MKISPQVDFAFKVLIVILSAFASGAAYRPSFISVDVAHDIAGMSSAAAFIVSNIYTLLGTGSVPSITWAGKVACWIFAGLLVTSLLIPSHAEAQTRLKLPIALPQAKPLDSLFGGALKGTVTGKPLSDLQKVYAAIQAMSLDDLTAAKADADATKDGLASDCYGPLIVLVKAQQSVDVSKLEDKPRLVLTFQRGRDLYNALRPGSPVQKGCAPMAEQIKTDIVTLIAQVAAGTITMASFGL